MSAALSNPLYQLALASVLGFAGVVLLLPRPKGRSVAAGIALVIASLAIFGAFALLRFGPPVSKASSDDGIDWIGSSLFGLFSIGAVVFGVALVVQRNPARGAIAFAFVILSSCGLFLLLAAPFLMAATIIIYAGAIIVTFLFVLMLSPVRGPADENDRSREPLLGSLAGFAFTGLVLFTLHLSLDKSRPMETNPTYPLPAPLLIEADAKLLASAERKASDALALDDGEEILTAAEAVRGDISEYGASFNTYYSSPSVRLAPMRSDPRIAAFLIRHDELLAANGKLDNAILNRKVDTVKTELKVLREKIAIYRGSGQLPARNVANLGFILYSEYLLAVEMAGTLLLVATIGAVAIAGRRKGSAA